MAHLLAWIMLTWATVANAHPRIDAPCSACSAIATELQTRIDNEPVRNHLDMRHRLDSSGQRYGKVIDYKVSELRAIELLEDLCKAMSGWTLVSVNSSDGSGKTIHWEQVSLAAPQARPHHQEEDARQKQLGVFCGRVLEEHDEEITDAIQQGKLENGGANAWLCKDLLGACPVRKRDSNTKGSTMAETADGTTSVMSAGAAAALAQYEAEKDKMGIGAMPDQPDTTTEPPAAHTEL